MAITNFSSSTVNLNNFKRNNLGSQFRGRIEFIASKRLSTYAGTTPPTGTQAGDFVVVVGECDDNAATVPTGFESISTGRDNTVGWTTSYRVWQPGDTNIVVTGTSATESVYAIYTFRNVASLQTPVPTPVLTGTGGGTVSFPAITTASEYAFVVRAASIDEMAVSSVTWPAPFTLAGTFTNSAAGGGDDKASVSLAYYELAVPGTVSQGTATFTPTSSGQGDNAGVTFALIPGNA